MLRPEWISEVFGDVDGGMNRDEQQPRSRISSRLNCDNWTFDRESSKWLEAEILAGNEHPIIPITDFNHSVVLLT